jgi:hypothetical protein
MVSTCCRQVIKLPSRAARIAAVARRALTRRSSHRLDNLSAAELRAVARLALVAKVYVASECLGWVQTAKCELLSALKCRPKQRFDLILYGSASPSGRFVAVYPALHRAA